MINNLTISHRAHRFALLAVALSMTPAPGKAGALPPPPSVHKSDTTDNYHGTTIADPYRWLEDADSTETRQWVEAQNKRTEAYLKDTKFPAFRDRLEKLWNFERLDPPHKEVGYYYYSRNSGLQNQPPIYRRKGLHDKEELVLDPNNLSKDGTVSLSSYDITRDGRWFAYMTAQAGSDWNEAHVLDLSGKTKPTDNLKWLRYTSLSWTRDGAGFFYERFPEPKGKALSESNYYQKCYYHRLGTPQSDDPLVYERLDDKEMGCGSHVTDDGKFLIITMSHGTDVRTGLAYADLSKGIPAPKDVVSLLKQGEAEYSFVGNVGRTFYVMTNKNASRRCVIAIDLDKPAPENWRPIIRETRDAIDEGGLTLIHDQLIVSRLHDAHSVIERYDLDGKKLGDIALPEIGTAGGFSAKQDDTELFFSFQSYTRPTSVFRYEVTKNSLETFFEPTVSFNPADFVTTQEFATSRDGTTVPLFIVHKKGLKKNPNTATRLYGYGGFAVNETPHFAISLIPWLEAGGVYAEAVLRGGNEYGEEWHQAGMLAKKQNVFDDFAAAAEWLIKNGYTSRDHIGIHGGSNGGLLVGASITQHPDLFRAACADVGVMDMLRFHKYTIGWAWTTEYGCADKPDQFAWLIKYSPLHNIKEGTSYPATLLLTGDHDDRVVPAHSYKFAATLQAAQAGPNPILLHVDTKAGHGAGKPTSKRIDEAAIRLAFFAKELDLK